MLSLTPENSDAPVRERLTIALKGLGYEVSLWRMILFTTPIVLSSVVLGALQFLRNDRRRQAGTGA